MVAYVTILFAFPLGFLLRNRLSAFLAYAVLYGYSFTFQTLYLTRDWVGGSTRAFPKDPGTVPVAYFIVTGGVYLVGFGLVALGHRLGVRRRARRADAVAVDLDRAH
jgi:hypothetical protein